MDETREAQKASKYFKSRSEPTQPEKPVRLKIKFDAERYDNSFRLINIYFPPALEALKGTFKWPVANDAWSEIGQYHGETLQDIRHNGLDINAPAGTQITTAYGGKVLIREDGARNKKWNTALVDVHVFDERTGLWQIYGHLDLEYIRKHLQDGQQVETGDPIGIIGKFEYDEKKYHHLHYQLEHTNLRFFALPLIKSRSVNPLHLLEDLRKKS